MATVGVVVTALWRMLFGDSPGGSPTSKGPSQASDGFPLLGVRASVFVKLLASIVDKNTATLANVHHTIIGPALQSQDASASYVSFLAGQGQEGASEDVGTANVFVAHGWNCLFADLVDIIQQHAKENPGSFYWLDALALPWQWSEEAREDKLAEYSQGHLGKFPSILLSGCPWNDPEVSKYPWVALSIFNVMEEGGRVEYVFPAAAYEAIKESFVASPSAATKNPRSELELPKMKPESKLFTAVAEAMTKIGAQGLHSAFEKAYIEGLCVVAEKIREQDPASAAKMYWAIGEKAEALGLGNHLQPRKLCWEIQRQIFGESNNATVSTCNNLGGVYFRNDMLEDAIACFNIALKHMVATFGENSDDVAHACSNIANAYLHNDQFAEAIEHFERAIRIQHVLKPDGDDFTGKIYACLGLAYLRMRQPREAQSYLERGLKIHLDTVGEADGGTADVCLNLALAYMVSDQLDKAIPMYERMLECRTKAFGEKHPKTAQANYIVGEVLSENGGPQDRAIQYHQKALAIRIELFGEKHPETAQSYQALGDIYFQQSLVDSAEEYYKKALASSEYFGSEHPAVGQIYVRLGKLFAMQEKWKEAREHLEKGLHCFTSTLGENHKLTATTCYTLGNVCRDDNNTELGVEYYLRSLRIRRAIGDPDAVDTLHNLGLAYNQLRDLDKAEQYLTEALKVSVRINGEVSPATAEGYMALSQIMKGRGTTEALEIAIEHLKTAIKIDTATLGELHEHTGICFANLGGAYLQKRAWDDAIAALQRSINIFGKCIGMHHPNTLRVYETLATAFALKGDLESALMCAQIGIKCGIALGEGHPSVQALVEMYVQVMAAMQKKKAAQNAASAPKPE